MRIAMRIAAGLAAALSLASCATPPPPAPPCADGQQRVRTAQLFFGRNVGDRTGVSEEAFRRFMDEELTPRFPDGMTVMDGGGQWRGPENQMIRDASKIVLIVLPRRSDAMQRINAVRGAYKARFKQDSVLLITQAACVSF